MGLADGTIDILVGTHAIFQEKVAYKNLGLAVIDEQHRFGVSQRLLLSSKAEHPPHLLVMTATPIPRTLTLTQYGEMDVSRIDEMPPGRTPVETRVISEARLPEIVDGLGRHVSASGQAYWVCPLVEESEKMDAAAAEERARLLCQRFGEDKIGLVHGRMATQGIEEVTENAIRAVARDCGSLSMECSDVAGYVQGVAGRIGEHLKTLDQLEEVTGRLMADQARVSDSTDEARLLSEQAKAKLEAGREAIEGTIDGFKGLTELVVQLGERMAGFAAAMNQVQMVSSTIETIARKTNMTRRNALGKWDCK